MLKIYKILNSQNLQNMKICTYANRLDMQNVYWPPGPIVSIIELRFSIHLLKWKAFEIGLCSITLTCPLISCVWWLLKEPACKNDLSHSLQSKCWFPVWQNSFHIHHRKSTCLFRLHGTLDDIVGVKYVWMFCRNNCIEMAYLHCECLDVGIVVM